MPSRPTFTVSGEYEIELPNIGHDDPFRQVVRKLSLYFKESIELPSTFEQLRTTPAGNCLRVLVDHLAKTCTNPATVNALLALKWHYASDDEHHGVGQAKSNACEIVAWRFLSRFTERDALDYCLYEIPEAYDPNQVPAPATHDREAQETSPLLSRLNPSDASGRPVGSSRKRVELLSSLSRLTNNSEDDNDNFDDPTCAYEGLNALEIAAVADAKRFLSQSLVQKIITGIWNGNIVYWDALTINATKKPRFYNPHTSDLFARLRVPKYMKCFEVVFFGAFLCLYYALLIRGKTEHMTSMEVALFIWFAAFFYDEFGEWRDAGSIFYTTDIWNFFDILVIFIGLAFVILRILGLSRGDSNLSGWAFDVLSLEALFMIPRICSILSLSPYWGTLIPCLKEMGRDFIKFMVLVVIFYFGFLTTFSLIGRQTFNIPNMAMILTQIFFGSSSLGFDIMDDIDPVFGPPLMLIFVIFTNFLLLGSLTGMLSNSFMRVTDHAEEEYLYVYAVYILEASTSNRVTHFYPPFNILAFIIFRPWSLLFPKSTAIRTGRIMLLKATHLPIVVVIKFYELFKHSSFEDQFADFKGPDGSRGRNGRSGVPAIQSSSFNQQLAVPGQTKTRRLSEGQEGDVSRGSGVEAQIHELHKKIDLLTQAVLAMQENGHVAGKAAA